MSDFDAHPEPRTTTTVTSQVQTEQSGWGDLPHDTREVVNQKGWKEPADAVRSYASLEKHVGQKRLPAPPQGEELAQWEGWRELGVPSHADGYELTRPDLPDGMGYDDNLERTAREAAAFLKLAPFQLQGVLDTYARYQTDMVTRAQDQQRAHVTQILDGLKRKWGSDFDSKHRCACRFAEFIGLDTASEQHMAAVMSYAPMVERFAELGRTLGDHNFVTGHAPDSFAMTPDRAEAEIKRLEADPETIKIMMDKRHPRYQQVMNERRHLYAIAYPGPNG